MTIVPSAGMATMYDHQFQAGVPYFLQWAGPMEAYEQIALERDLPDGEHFGEKPEETGCGLPNSSLTAGEAQLSGQYTAWHGERDWREAATAADIPVFMVHGVNDNAARVAGMDWFTAACRPRTATRSGSASGTTAPAAARPAAASSGPTRCTPGSTATSPSATSRPAPRPSCSCPTGPSRAAAPATGRRSSSTPSGRVTARTLTLHPAADGTLGETAPLTPGSASFTGDPAATPTRRAPAASTSSPRRWREDTVLAGKPVMDLVASVTSPRVHLIGTLYDESPDGERRRISQFAINPELRVGVATPKPVIPGQLMQMEPPGFAMAHDLRQGHRLVLRFTTSDPDKVPTFAVDPLVTIATGPGGTVLQVPVVGPAGAGRPTPFPSTHDQPAEAGPAQAEEQASVTPTLGGPARTPVTVAFHEFEVLDGFDNAALLVSAVPSLDADIDLYLQRQNADGTWSADLTSGGSSSLTEEPLRYATPAPGVYRVEVHNWAGAPSTRVDLTLTYLNTAGEAG